jgi:hypothetical protein
MEQLEAEPWWNREITTSAMVGLGLQMRTAFQAGKGSVGIKGNAVHLSGGHRSQEWIRNSRYCTNRTYTVQSSLSGDELRVCSAIDFVPAIWGTVDNRNKMKLLTSRAISAMKAGQCDEVIEVFGTLDGVHVTGWRNDLNKTATSDSSHLDHLHLRFGRQYCNDSAVMAKVAQLLLEDDMPTVDEIADEVWGRNVNASDPNKPKSAWGTLDEAHDAVVDVQNRMTALENNVQRILEAVSGSDGGGTPAAGGSFTGTWTSAPPSTTGTTAGTAGQ